jgi:hypothetical protein
VKGGNPNGEESKESGKEAREEEVQEVKFGTG